MNAHGQTICLTMIVKDEAHVILRALKSVRDVVDYYCIADTGSTDGTPEVVESYLKENGLKGEVVHHKWKNFGHNRTLALEACKDRCDYQLTLDADEVFVNLVDDNPSGDKLNEITEHLTADIYYITCFLGGISYKRNQLWKSNVGVAWSGVCHEFITKPTGTPATFGEIKSFCNKPIQDGARSKDPQKYLKDAKLFEDYLKENPKCARSWFYLAQCYADAGKTKEAIEPTLKAYELSNWPEEKYMSLYKAAAFHQAIAQEITPEALYYYLKAYEERPQRKEPLFNLLHYYRTSEKYKLGEMIADQIKSVKPPSGEILFVDEAVYNWRLEDEISIIYYWVGRYEEGYALCLKLLDSGKLPETEIDRVKANAWWCKKNLDI